MLVNAAKKPREGARGLMGG